MMPDHWIDAKKLGYDLEKEADYKAYAVNLYNRTGTKHWEFDSHKGGGPACWGNTLAQIAKEPNFSYALKIKPPVEEFGAETTVPDGYNFNWGESKGAFVVKNQVGSQARYDRKKKLLEDLPGYSKRLVFKSLDKNPEEIILKLERAIR
jgi:hypothetical protein